MKQGLSMSIHLQKNGYPIGGKFVTSAVYPQLLRRISARIVDGNCSLILKSSLRTVSLIFVTEEGVERFTE